MIYYDEESFMNELFENNTSMKNRGRDLQIMQKYIDRMNSSNPYTRGTYLNFDGFKGNNFDKTDIVNLFNDGGSGMMVYGNSDIKQDYRITLKNSSNITKEHASIFVRTLIEEIKKRKIEVRMKNMWETDAIILYVSSSDLPKIVSLLEDFKDENKYKEVSSATKEFGSIMPLSATVGDTPYYGITTSHILDIPKNNSQNGLFMSIGGVSNNGGIYTFNEYTSNIMYDSYMELLQKYNGDKSKITPSELYDSVLQMHKKRQDMKEDENIPLWMRKSNYTDFMTMKEKLEERKDFKSDVPNQSQKRVDSFFFRPTSITSKNDEPEIKSSQDSDRLFISSDLKQDRKNEIEKMRNIRSYLETMNSENPHMRNR